MIHPTSVDWGKWGIENDLHRLFLLHWAEIFDSQTPDSWQSRTVNFRTILKEIIHVIDITSEYFDYRHNIPTLLDEATSIAAVDPILSKHFPVAASLLPTDCKPLTGGEAADHLPNLRRTVAAIVGHLSNYPKVLIRELRDHLASGDAKEKKQLYNLTFALATQWVTAGYSATHLSAGVQVLTDPAGGTFLERFDTFVGRCDGKPRKYRCRLSLVVPESGKFATEETLYDLTVFRQRPQLPLREAEAAFYGRPDEGEFYIEHECDATDATIARRMSEERVASIFAAMSLFSPNKRPDLRGKTALVWEWNTSTEGWGDPTLVPLRRFRPLDHWRVDDLAQRTRNYLNLASRLSLADRDQIESVLQYHRLSIQASSDEARLVSLWISAETLCRRCRTKDSIIHTMCEYLAPSVAVGNIRKLVTSLCIYLNEFRWKNEGLNFSEVFPNMDDEGIPPTDLLDVLVENDGRLEVLGGMISDNTLLLFRVFRAWEMLKDKGAVGKNLELNRRNVAWQLRRIYRARNEVMHTGRATPIVARLIQHLHSYLAVALNNIIFDLQEHAHWSIPDALKHRAMMFEVLCKAVADGNNLPKMALLDPSRIFHQRTPPYVWETVLSKTTH